MKSNFVLNAPTERKNWVKATSPGSRFLLACVLISVAMLEVLANNAIDSKPAMPAGTKVETVYVQCPPDTDGLDTDGDGITDNDNVCLHLTAGDGLVKMADGMDLYCFGFMNVTGVPEADVMMEAMLGAEFSAPTITVKEGQHLYLTLTNVGMYLRPDLFDSHSVHFHGFPNAAPVYDGEPMASATLDMGGSFTYYYNLVTPGTFMYHCHVEAAEHMQMGMLGQLYVLAKQNNLADSTNLNGFTHHTGYKYAYDDGDGATFYDVEVPIQLASFDPVFHEASRLVQPLFFSEMLDTYPMINGRGYPDTVNPNPIMNNRSGHSGMPDKAGQPVDARIVATKGQKILLRISSLATTEFYTVRVLGIPMKIVGRGAAILRGPDPDGTGPLVGKNLYYSTSSIDLGGGEAVDAILDTSTVSPGTYFLYTTNLNHLSNNLQDYGGMMTEIVVNP